MKHKTRTKALSWLLSLALMLSLMPGMSLTAQATGWTGGTYTASANETIDVDVTVSEDATLTINSGVTLTVNGGIIMAQGKTLTVAGAGTLVVTGKVGANGNDGANQAMNGGAGGIGAAGITGNLVVNGATVQVTGGKGGNGGNGRFGGNGGNGGSGVVGNITVNSGSATVTGGSGGSGGRGWVRDDGVAGSVGRAVTGTITGTIISGSATGQTVTVEAATTVDVTGVTLAPDTAQSIDVGGSVAFTATVAPDNATDKKVKWSTTGGVTLYSDENCTSPITTGTAISTLTVYAKGTAAGSATVTVTTNNGNKSASSNVTVNEAQPSTYTLTIPSTLSVANSGWNATTGISATGTLASGKKLTVTASSANSWALKSGDNSVGYNLATATGTYSSSATPASWEFTELSNTAATKPMGIIVEDYTDKPAGTYTDTVTFTASVVEQAITFTVKRVGGSDPNFTDGNYTVAPGTTWQQFIQSDNAPACLSIGTSGIYNGKVCHDMNYGLQECGGTIIANTADNRRVRIDEAIIDGATYGCSYYLGYQDHD